MTSNCTLRISLVEPPWTYIYGSLFIIGAIFTTFINGVALVILFVPSKKSTSNKILISLAVSDFLAGCVLFPIMAYQMLDASAKKNCPVDYAKTIFATLLSGSSVLNLIIVAIDRYILLTKYTSYDKLMRKRNILIFIAACWLIPAVIPVLRYTNPIVYLTSLMLLFFAPIIIMAILYVILTLSIHRHQQYMLNTTDTNGNGEMHMISSTDGYDSETLDDSIDESPSTPSKITSLKACDSPAIIVKSKMKAEHKRKKSHKQSLKVAKSVAILLGFYLLCSTPFNIWLLLSMIKSKRITPRILHNLYIFANFVGTLNSGINPIIYISKQPKFRKIFKRYLLKTDLKISSSSKSNA